MPQLDAATYRSQVFWLTLFFGLYYLVALNFLMPAIASRRKTRAKKANVRKGRVSSFDGERQAALAGYDGTLASSTSWLAGHLTAVQADAARWREASVQAADASALEAANKAYLEAVSSTSAQRLLAARLGDQ